MLITFLASGISALTVEGTSKLNTTNPLKELFLIISIKPGIHEDPKVSWKGVPEGDVVRQSFAKWQWDFCKQAAGALMIQVDLEWQWTEFINEKNDDHALKAHKVRSWRVWAETGKRYHWTVSARRKRLKEGKEEEEDFSTC
jgi:hypothetical protein